MTEINEMFSWLCTEHTAETMKYQIWYRTLCEAVNNRSNRFYELIRLPFLKRLIIMSGDDGSLNGTLNL